MITEAVGRTFNADGSVNYSVPNEILEELYDKGLAFPDPVHVTYNFGTKKMYKKDKDGNKIIDKKTGKPAILKEYPILTTIVEWSTGDKTIVTNAANDGLQLDENGKPTSLAKEIGFAFAVTKKMMTSRYSYDIDSGELVIKQDGFGAKLSEVVSNATDMQHVAEVKKQQKIESAKRKKEAEQKHAEKMAKPPRMSLAEAMDKLAQALKDIEELKSHKCACAEKAKKAAAK